MQFLRTIFWVILAVVAVVFSLGNWTPVTLELWGDVQVDSKLPVLLIGAFLLGLLPMLVVHRASRWRLRKRIESTERALNEVRGIPTLPAEDRESIPPASVPTAVPPGVA
jgi:uncharacterized integral membrane protein